MKIHFRSYIYDVYIINRISAEAMYIYDVYIINRISAEAM